MVNKTNELSDPIQGYVPNPESCPTLKSTSAHPKREWRIKRFLVWIWFAKPRAAKHDLNLLENLEVFLNAAQPSEENLKISKRFIELHRITENTSARKRLEKWARRLIQWYLIIVGIIIVAQGLEFITLSQPIFITLLSTTTVNILGLGFIVLKGHFPDKKKGTREDEDPDPVS